VFLKYGVHAVGGLSIGLVSAVFCILCLRGPHAPIDKWVGWQGGASIRKGVVKKPVKQQQSSSSTSSAATAVASDQVASPQNCRTPQTQELSGPTTTTPPETTAASAEEEKETEEDAGEARVGKDEEEGLGTPTLNEEEKVDGR
jgi:hypothetical protein